MFTPLRIVPRVAVLAALSFTSHTVLAEPPSTADQAASSSVDNTAVNVRDKTGETLTPTDQPNNAADIDVAAAVRRAITKDTTLSLMAHNVKLVASAGVVTLRGPVSSEMEKTKVEQLAAAAPGVSSVRNELDIKQ